MNQYDLLIIGGGPGGYPGALAALKYGWKVAIAEEREIGGTCLNRGCVPTKTLLHTTEVLREAREEIAGETLRGEVSCDAAKLFARKDEVVGTLRTQVEAALKKGKIDLLRGHAKIVAPGKVEVASAEGAGIYETGRILIAAGSVPARIPVEGANLPGVITSDEILNGTGEVPKRLVIE